MKRLHRFQGSKVGHLEVIQVLLAVPQAILSKRRYVYLLPASGIKNNFFKLSQTNMNNESGSKEVIIRKLADAGILSFVRADLSPGDMLTIKELNADCIYLLEEHDLVDISDNYKTHIKILLFTNIENISFVRPSQRNESEQVVSRIQGFKIYLWCSYSTRNTKNMKIINILK